MLADIVDGPSVEPLAKLARGEDLTDDERWQVALFVAVQDHRTPQKRDVIRREIEKLGKHLLRFSATRPEYVRQRLTELGHAVDDEQLSDIVSRWSAGDIDLDASKITWLQTMEVALDIAELIYTLPWRVLSAPRDYEFLTSDAPVVRVATDRSVPEHLRGGWLSPSPRQRSR